MAFDPSKPFKVIEESQLPRFDPSKPFNVINQTQQPQQATQLEDGEGSDFMRGIGTYYDQMGGIFGGAKVLTGKALGSDNFIKSGLESMEESEAAIGRRGVKETDSFLAAIDKGVGSFLTEYIPFVAGQGVGMIGEAVLTGVAGSVLGSVVGPGGTVAGGLGGFVGKGLIKKKVKQEAERIAKEQGQDAADLYVEKQAKDGFKELMEKDLALRSQVNRTIGKNAALIQMAAKFGTGEVTGRAVDEAIKDITDPDEQLEAIKELNTGRLAGVSTAHALADYIGIKIGLGALDKLAEPTQSMLFNIAKKIGSTGGQEAIVEAVQTGIERFGAYLPLGDKQAMDEYINAAAAGFFMPIVPSAISGIRTTPATPIDPETKPEDTPKIKPKNEAKDTGGKKKKTKAEKDNEEADKVTDPLLEIIEKDAKPFRARKTKKDKIEEARLKKIVKDEQKKLAKTKNSKAKAKAEQKIAKAKAELAAFEMPDFEETNQQIIDKSRLPLAFTPKSDAEIATEEQISESEVAMGPVREGFERIQIGYDRVNNSPILEDRVKKEINPDRFELTSPQETTQETVDVEEEITTDPLSENLPGIPTIQDQEAEIAQAERDKQDLETKAKQEELAENIAPESDIAEADRIVKTVLDNNGVFAREVIYQSDAGPVNPQTAKDKALRQIKNSQIEQGLTETHTIKEVKGRPRQEGEELVSDTVVYYLAPRKSVGTLSPNASQNANKLSKFLIDNLDVESQDVKQEGALVLGKTANPAQIKKWFKDNVTAAEFNQIEKSAKGIFARINTIFNQPSTTKQDEAQTAMEEAFSKTIADKAKQDSSFTGPRRPAKSKSQGKETIGRTIKSKEFLEESADKQTVGDLLATFRKNLRAITKGVVDPMQEALLTAFEDMPGIANTNFKVLNFIKQKGKKISATGTYNTKSDTVRVTKDASLEDVFHEITHAATSNAIRNQVKDGKGTTRAGKRTVAIYKAAQKADKNNEFKEALSNIDEFITYALTNKEFQMFLAQTPSAVATPTTVTEGSLWSNFVGAVKDLLGLGDISNTLLNDVLAVAPELMKGPRAKEQEARKDEVLFKKNNVADFDKEAAAAQPNKTTKKQKVEEAKKAFEPGRFKQILKNLRRTLQNSQAYIQAWQNELDRAGLIIGGLQEGFNDIFDKITLNRGLADIAFKRDILPNVLEFQRAQAKFLELAKKAGMQNAEGQLNLFFTALHDSERRDILFALGVPLSSVKNLKVGTTRKSAQQLRDEYMQLITKRRDLTENQIKQIRKQLFKLTSDKNNHDAVKGLDYRGNPIAKSKNNKTAKDVLNKNSNRYNPSKYNKTTMDNYLAKYNSYKQSNPELYNAMQAVRDSMTKLNDAALELNQKAFYTPIQSMNIIRLYGFENYVPLKAESNTAGKTFNVDAPRVSGDLVDAASPIGGQKGTASNIFEQVVEDALQAAARTGRSGVTQAVKNAVTFKYLSKYTGQKKASRKALLDGTVQSFTAEERFKNPTNVASALRNVKDKIVNYNKDGSIDVISIKDKDLLEGIKGTYRENSLINTTPILNMLPGLTSWVGQMHTRFNIAFAPLNFIRDTLTNAAIISSEMGADAAADFGNRMAKQIYQAGLLKTARIANKFANTRDIEGIEAYVKSEKKKGNTYAADMWDFLSQGGAVSYRQAITDLKANQEMRDQIAIKGLKKTGNAIKGFFDGYMSTFELSARVAAYQTKLQDLMSENAYGQTQAELAKSNPALLEANKGKAAAFSKNLANFEQVGQLGKVLGDVFMFFRPSATGAARGIDAIAPIFVKDFDAYAQSLPDNIKNNPVALKNYRKSFEKQQASAKATVASLIGIGMVVPVLAMLMGGEDEEGRSNTVFDDSSRWLRFARFDLGDGDTIQIPWGFGIGGFAAAGTQLTFLINGMSNPDTENSPGKFIGNMINIGLDSFLPLPVSRVNPLDNPLAWLVGSLTPSAARPIVEYTMNLNAFGQPIYNPRQSLKYGDAYGGTDNIPQAYKDASIKLAEESVGAINIEPNTLYFLGNNYADGILRITSNLYGLGQTLLDNKQFEPKRDFLFLDSFISRYSKVDQRAFSRVVKESKDIIERVNLFKETNPEKFIEYISKNPMGLVIEERYNKLVNGDLKEITSLMKQIRTMPGLTPKEKNEMVEVLKEQQNAIKRAIAFELDIYLNEEVY